MIDIVSNPESYQCLDESLWLSSGPQDCTWPIDKEDVRVRSLDNRGDHSCSKPVEFMSSLSMELYNTDGPRFINPDEPYGIDRTQRITVNAEFNWGFTCFDDFGSAFLTSFQILTVSKAC